MISISHNGVKLNCRVAGSLDAGQPALFIHGLNTNMAFWHPRLVRRLARSRRLMMFDLRGHGYSDLPPSGYTSANLACDAAAVLDAFDVESADVVAHSFGAAVALQLVRLAPERVRSLVILDGRLRLLQPDLRLRDWSQFERWRSRFEEAGIRVDPDLELDFRLPMRIDQRVWSLVREGLIADGFFVPAGGPRTAAKYEQLLTTTTAADDLRSDAGLTQTALRRVRQPMLAVYGLHSPYLPTRDGLLGEIAGCRAEDIPEAGHNFPFLLPDPTASTIESFWQDLPDLPAPGEEAG